ncbi:hypothetical protein PU560_10225 [Georgenia sp. 10Sc9-8]|uniref:Integral membrane protein n=1 Tax=Georgenia halotolerans TaxID=3028317 RepID=A0ABT5TXP7_9MICO|nr:hypothetical protein [Georgenia halotolerans]
MDILHGILLVLHMLGWAIVLGASVVNLRPPRIAKGVTHGAITALVTGLLMVGTLEMGDADVNHVKIGIKLLVAAVVTAMAVYGARREDKVTTGYVGALAGLTALNIAIAVLW